MLTHALYDESVSRSIVYLASVCDLTQRASVSMRKCADWVNLKFVYNRLFLLVPLVTGKTRHLNGRTKNKK